MNHRSFCLFWDVVHQSGLWQASLYITAVPVDCLPQQHRTMRQEPSSTGLVHYIGFGKNSVTRIDL